jgi:hypothetical protein
MAFYVPRLFCIGGNDDAVLRQHPYRNCHTLLFRKPLLPLGKVRSRDDGARFREWVNHRYLPGPYVKYILPFGNAVGC